MPSYSKALGMRLFKIRTARNMTQAEVGALAGIKDNHYANIEKGTRVPSLETFIAIANALQIDANYLLRESLTALQGMDAPVAVPARLFMAEPRRKMED